MRFKNSPQLPGAGRTRAGHHHGSDKPTSPRAIYVLKSANGGLFYTSLYQNKAKIMFCRFESESNTFSYFNTSRCKKKHEQFIRIKHLFNQIHKI